MPRKYRVQAVSIVLALAVLGCEQTVTDVVDWTVDANHPSITAPLLALISGGDLGGVDLTPTDGDILSGSFTGVRTFTNSQHCNCLRRSRRSLGY